MEPGTRLGPYEIIEQLGAGGMAEVYRARSHRPLRCAALLLAVLLAPSCAGRDSGPSPLTAEVPLHLEEHLDVATVVGSEVPADAPAVMEWHFDEPQEDWKPVVPFNPTIDPVEVTQFDDALRVTYTDGTRNPNGLPNGGLVLEAPDWNYEDLGNLVVRARTSDDVRNFWLFFNRREGTDTDTDLPNPFEHEGETVPVVSDGTVQTYRARPDFFRRGPPPEGRIRQIALWFAPDDLASIDILSITLIPKVATYAEAGAASRTEIRNRIHRQALYTHTPGRVEYRVKIPEAGRLDFAMGVLREDVPVTFRVTAIRDGAEGGEPTAVFEEHYADKEAWGQRSVDLADFAGQTVTLGLKAESEDGGRVALWGAPTVTGGDQSVLPNVVFYVFDGGAADYMSVYGYNRRTTPTLERLAEEGVVFERAYSNSSWTVPSTASFMTSLHTSVTGGSHRAGNVNPLPAEAVTMAEHMHQAGYQTAVFTGNPGAGTLSDLQRGVDLFREDWEDFSYGGNNHKESSKYLHEGFWSWREDYPRQPFWAHFQTTDTHEDFPAPPPFGGLFVTADERESMNESFDRLGRGGHRPYSPAWDSTGISQTALYSVGKGLYDEAMAHNDYRLGQLIDRLKVEGEWDNTLLIIGGDHSIRAAYADMGLVLSDPLPPPWSQPILRPTISRVPLMFVWPSHIEGGQRIAPPVSMIDVLPTLLDLVGLPPAEIAQGQSLAPLMLGREGWEPRPVILDEFYADSTTGDLEGVIEVVDGRWGASLEINDPDARPRFGPRPVPLLLYDLWNDPMALWSLHEERPDLVQKYTAFLEEQFEAHVALSQYFTPGEDSPLTPEQLRSLRALGYIR